MDFQGKECYIRSMAERPETVTEKSTAAYIRGLAAQHHVTYVQTQSDLLAQHMTRLADDAVQPDEIECMLFACIVPAILTAVSSCTFRLNTCAKPSCDLRSIRRFRDRRPSAQLRKRERSRNRQARGKRAFTTGLDEAFASLAKAKTLSYDDVLKTDGILFGAVYPWAGQDAHRQHRS